MNDATVPGGQQAHENADLRNLAIAIDSPPPTSCRVITGEVVAVNLTETPPNIDVKLQGDEDTTVEDVSFVESYSPVVGDIVNLLKQGSTVFALGQIVTAPTSSGNGWTQMSLESGFTHNGNSNGNAEFRVVVDNGDRKLQLRGGVAVSGTPVLVCVLPEGSRPSTKRSLLIARDIQGGSVVAQIDVLTNGVVQLIGPTTGVTGVASSGGGTTSSSDPNDSTTSTDTDHKHRSSDFPPSSSSIVYTDHWTDYIVTGGTSHSHGVIGSHSHTTPNHTHTMTAVSFPTWLSFNGVECYL